MSSSFQVRLQNSNSSEKTSDFGFSQKAKTQDVIARLNRPIVTRQTQNIIQKSTACPCGGGCPACVAERFIAPQQKPVQTGRNLPVQASLKVGAANDAYEQEADRVADAIMRMPGPKNNEANSMTENLWGGGRNRGSATGGRLPPLLLTVNARPAKKKMN